MVPDCKKKCNFALVEVRTIKKKGRENKVWYAIRVTYNRELKVKEDLDARDIRCFVPMQYRREERGGVMVKRLVPSVHNLIFIYLTPSEMKEYKMSTELPIRYIMNRETGKPIIVPNREMENSPVPRVCLSASRVTVAWLSMSRAWWLSPPPLYTRR